MLSALFAVAGASALQSMVGGMQQQKQIKAQNKEIARVNAINTLEAFQGVSAIEVQRGRLRQQTAKTLALVDQRAEEEAATTGAVAAAAGVKGASVDAVRMDIDRAEQEAQFEIEQQHITQEYDLNQRIRELMVSTQNSLGSMQKVPSTGNIIGGALLSGALSAAVCTHPPTSSSAVPATRQVSGQPSAIRVGSNGRAYISATPIGEWQPRAVRWISTRTSPRGAGAGGVLPRHAGPIRAAQDRRSCG